MWAPATSKEVQENIRRTKKRRTEEAIAKAAAEVLGPSGAIAVRQMRALLDYRRRRPELRRMPYHAFREKRRINF